ncbi:hypothetical protein [Nonomuraea sp. LPB2021202275-12-8]|uniref:hypothetical protein n=1 Tax=Nonomuraea sp. LPB2021202275-12-8 TaxID=3120159 RepID=UPI00300C792F
MGDQNSRRIDAARLARAHGMFNVAGGLWPVVHMSSFEKVFGPKTDRWLVRTVGGLLTGIGWNQLRAASSPEGVEHARRFGVSAASTLLRIDLMYALTGRIPAAYLLDAAAEAGWIYAWRHSAPPRRTRGGGGARSLLMIGAVAAGAIAGAALATAAAIAMRAMAEQARGPDPDDPGPDDQG